MAKNNIIKEKYYSNDNSVLVILNYLNDINMAIL